MESFDAESRRRALAALLAEHGFVSVADASTRLGVSEVTLRADLTVLAARGVARRVHGGAVAAGSVRESPVEAAAARDAGLKRSIGVAAAALVSSGSSLMLDVGSTTHAVATALVARTDLSDVVVITNGLSIALTLEAAIPRFTVVVTAGTLRPLQHSLVDALAIETIRGLHADLAILGCSGVADGQVTNVNLPEAAVKRQMIASSSARVLVADASKFGRSDLSAVAPLAAFGTVVTAGPAADTVEVTSATRLVVAA